MGAGSSFSFLEAPYKLHGPIAAGSWGLVGDGIVAGNDAKSINVLFEVRWRKQGQSDASGDTVLMSASNTFLRNSAALFDAAQFSTTVPGIAADAHEGDTLILRITATGGDSGALFIPNGDGDHANGRIPRIDLPVVAK